MFAAHDALRVLKRWDIVHVRIVSHEVTRNHTFRALNIRGEQYFVKIYRDDPWGFYNLTPLRMSAYTKVMPVIQNSFPEVSASVWCEETEVGYTEGWRWDPLFEQSQDDLLVSSPRPLHNLGRFTSGVHQYFLNNPSDVLNDKTILDDQPFFWILPDFIAELAKSGAPPIPSAENIPSTVRRDLKSWGQKWLEQAPKGYREMYIKESTLLHGDLHFQNVRFDPDNLDVCAVIDWDSCRFDHPLREVLSVLRRVQLLKQNDLIEAFLSGYGEYHSFILDEDLLAHLLSGIRLFRTTFLIAGGIVEPVVNYGLRNDELELIEKIKEIWV